MANSLKKQADIYAFGDFRVDAAKRLLLNCDGEIMALTPKVFDTLLYLVKHAGKIIEKDELMREIWVNTIVEENNLSQNISILRRVLGEKRGEHRFIATVPGKGFKFVAEVLNLSELPAGELIPDTEKWRSEEAEKSSVDDFKSEISNLKLEIKDRKPKTRDRKVNRFRTIALTILSIFALGSVGYYLWRESIKLVPDAPIKTIAVLPFKPLVADKRDEALEMGMADTLISRLGDNREIVVRPLSSVRRYGNLEQDALTAGRSLAVESVLDGSIQRWGDKIRVNVRLIKVADGSLLWTGTFDEKFTDIFVVQDAISQRVAAALAFKLSGDEQKRLNKRYTENVEAYQAYSKGRFLWNKRTPQDLQKSIEYFEQAIALDPNYALAYTGLADAYALMASVGSPAREMMPKAKQAVLKALSLDDNLAEAHAALGQIVIYYDYDFAGAEREHRRAIELNPNYASAHQWYSELLTALGRHEEALAEMRRALEIEPLSLIANRQYGISLLFARKYDESIAQLKKTLELDANFAVAHSSISLVYRSKGDYAASVEELAKYEELIGEPQTAALMRESFASGGWQGFLQAMTGDQRPSNVMAYNTAAFYAALGEKDKAFVELNKSYETREANLALIKVDPRFDSLREDSRFAEILKRVNLG